MNSLRECLNLKIRSEEDMCSLGGRLSRLLRTGVVYLTGDLGAGKTTLARSWLRTLGVHGLIRSPTYTLIEPYQLSGGLSVFHMDLYRVSDPIELEDIGVREYFGPESLVMIEWPERGSPLLPQADPSVDLSITVAGRNAKVAIKPMLVESFNGLNT